MPPPSKATFREWMQSRLWGIGFPHPTTLSSLLSHTRVENTSLLSPMNMYDGSAIRRCKKYLNMHENVLSGKVVFFAKWQSMYGWLQRIEKEKARRYFFAITEQGS